MPDFLYSILPSSTQTVPLWLDLVAVVVGALSGALVASGRKLDMVGAVGLAMICGLGGGLIRDVIMQVGNVYMLESRYAIPVAVLTGLVVFFFHGPFERAPGLIGWVDIMSVGLFAASGTDKAMVYGLGVVAAVLMGVITSIGGGMLRDVFLGDVPYIFRRSNLYALCAVAGSASYYLATRVAGLEKPWAALLCTAVTVGLRRWSLRYNVLSPADIDLTPKVVEPMRKAKAHVSRSAERRRVTKKVPPRRDDTSK